MSFLQLKKSVCFAICGVAAITFPTIRTICFNDILKKEVGQAIPPEMLRLSLDGTILYGFKPEVRINEIAQNHYSTLIIPNSVRVIGDYAFDQIFDGLSCYVNTVVLHNKIESIGSHAFANCYGITSVNFSDLEKSPDSNLQKIGTAAFYRTNISGKLVIPHTVTSLGDNCFNFCESITSLTFPTSIRTVGRRAFAYCSHLSQIDFSAFESIPAWLYKNNLLFQDVGTMVQKDKTIIASTVVDNEEQWSICLFDKQGIPQDDAYTFAIVQTNQITPESVFNVLKDGDDYICKGFYGQAKDVLSKYYCVSIPGKVTKIDANAFKGITKNNGSAFLIMGANVTEIGDSAFAGSDAFTGPLTLPSKLKTIGNQAFYGTNFESVVMQKSITTIGTEAFANNPSLISAGIACETRDKYLKSWGDGKTFRQCPKLQMIDLSCFNVEFPEKLKQLTGDKVIFKEGEVCESGFITINSDASCIDHIIDPKGWNFTCFSPTDPNSRWVRHELEMQPCDTDFIKTSRVGTVVTGLTEEGLKNISSFSNLILSYQTELVGKAAFKNIFKRDLYAEYPTFWDVLFNQGLIKIEESAFELCTGLSHLLVLPKTLESIGDKAFANCTGFRGQLSLPESLKTIGKYAFMGCKFTGNLDLSKDMTIDDSAFSGTSFNSVTISNNTFNFGSRIFANNQTLKKIHLSNVDYAYAATHWTYKADSLFITNTKIEGATVFVKDSVSDWENLLKNNMGLPSYWTIQIG